MTAPVVELARGREVPDIYAWAPDLSEASRCALAAARVVWNELTKIEQKTLAACDHRGLVLLGSKIGRARLRKRGLTVRGTHPCFDVVTLLGKLVREAGVSRTDYNTSVAANEAP